MFWLAAAVMTGLAALAVLWPLGSRGQSQARSASEAAFYKAQLREIEEDVERGQLPADEAVAARTEAIRRLIAVSDDAVVEASPSSLVRRRIAAGVVLAVMPLAAIAVYVAVGSPNAADEPLAERRADPKSPQAIEYAIAKIESRLAAHPDDVRGWEVLAPVYMRLRRFDDAIAAYRQILRLKPPTAAGEAALGEALLAAAEGTVTGPSRRAFEKALEIDPQTPMARFYLALAAEQDGDAAKAKPVYEELEPQATGDAPWMLGLRSRLAALRGGDKPASPGSGGPAAGDGPAGFSPEQLTMIRGMVEGLAGRLAATGGSAEEWAKLIRAYSVLKETDKASKALTDARKAFAGNTAALGNFDALARELGIGG